MDKRNDFLNDSLKDYKWLQVVDPFKIFTEWFELAKQSEIEDPNAMALSTTDSQGVPNVRIVLLKGFDERGFVLYTNSLSTKGRELAENPVAACALHWKSMRRQVRFAGRVEQVSDVEADAYFSTRPRDSQIGAWASLQSQTMSKRGDFEKRIDEFKQKFENETVPRPQHWTGFRIVPNRIEFWQDRPFRLHDRLEFSKDVSDKTWTIKTLYP